MNKLKISIVFSLIICMLGTTGCSLMKNNKNTTEQITEKTPLNNSAALYNNQYYVWHDDQQTNIEKDIGCDKSKFKDYNYKIFNPVYVDEKQVPEDNNGIIMIAEKNDNQIPEYHQGDCLIFYSEDKIPREFILRKYYDHGYSIGVAKISETSQYSNQYSITDNSNIKLGSSMEGILGFLKNEKSVTIGTIGEIKLTYENLSEIGTIKGLLRGNSYDMAIYTGTDRRISTVTCDTRIFSIMGSYSTYRYDFVGNGIMIIQLPEYLESGYYTINNAGLFKYIKDEKDTDMNKPIDDEKVDKYEAALALEKEMENITNSDIINDNNLSGYDIRSFTVKKNESLIASLSIGNIVNDSVAAYPEITVYNSSNDANNKGGLNNPIIETYKLRENNSDYREFDLGEGVYIVVLKNISNYDSYKLDCYTTELETNDNEY